MPHRATAPSTPDGDEHDRIMVDHALMPLRLLDASVHNLGSLRYSVKEDILFATGNAGKVVRPVNGSNQGACASSKPWTNGSTPRLIDRNPPHSRTWRITRSTKPWPCSMGQMGARRGCRFVHSSLGDFPAFSARALDTIGCDGICGCCLMDDHEG